MHRLSWPEQNNCQISVSITTVPSLLEQFLEAKSFTKLDLSNAYNLVRIREGDEWKMTFRSLLSGHALWFGRGSKCFSKKRYCLHR